MMNLLDQYRRLRYFIIVANGRFFNNPTTKFPINQIQIQIERMIRTKKNSISKFIAVPQTRTTPPEKYENYYIAEYQSPSEIFSTIVDKDRDCLQILFYFVLQLMSLYLCQHSRERKSHFSIMLESISNMHLALNTSFKAQTFLNCLRCSLNKDFCCFSNNKKFCLFC